MTQAIADMELTGRIYVADTNLYYGIEAGVARYCVGMHDPEHTEMLDSGVIEVPAPVMHAIIRLFIEGDEGNEALYERITDAHLPADKRLRPIP